MEVKLAEEQKISNQMQTMVLLLLEKIKEMEVKLNKL